MAIPESLRQKATALLERMDLGGPVAQRRPPGRGSAVTPEEADDIRWAFVAEGKSISAISRETGRTRETISAIVRGAETDELRESIRELKRTRAKQILASATDTASELWVDSMKAAAEKGNHKPMQDLLLHEAVIQPVAKDAETGFVVLVGRGGVVNFGDATPVPALPAGRSEESA